MEQRRRRKTIKEIYDVKELPNEEDSLVKWHNEIEEFGELIEKLKALV